MVTDFSNSESNCWGIANSSCSVLLMVYAADLDWPVGPHQLSSYSEASLFCCARGWMLPPWTDLGNMVGMASRFIRFLGGIPTAPRWRLQFLKHSGAKCFGQSREVGLDTSQSFLYCCTASIHFLLSVASPGNLCKTVSFSIFSVAISCNTVTWSVFKIQTIRLCSKITIICVI